MGRRALALIADMTVTDQVQRLVQTDFDEMGALTCWVSNAGGADERAGLCRTCLIC